MLKLLGMSQRKAITLGVLLTCVGLAIGQKVYHGDWTETIIMTCVMGVTSTVFYAAWRLVTNDELLVDFRRQHGPIEDQSNDSAD